MPASIRDVAAEAKVSVGTVSKVLNRSQTAQIAPATQERVRDAARRLGYHPNAIARGLARGRMNTIGLVLAYNQPSVTSDPYLGPCLDGILAVNKRSRQKSVLFTEESWEGALENVPSYCDGQVDGLVLVLPRLGSAIVGALASCEVPFLLVGDSRDDAGLVCVDVDNISAAGEAVRHLTGLGHRRIAAFYDEEFCSSRQRLRGYRQALAAAGIACDASLLLPSTYVQEPGAGYAAMQALLDRPASERPTAVFCVNDHLALGALDALGEHGVRVPEEMSVVGFDDIPSAGWSEPALTTIRQPIRAVGERAAELLLERINTGAGAGRKVLLPAELIVRESTAPP